mmetsp:Transcript_53257/g.95580  ORF Transcript_53257/g.95580 Transcript_53257/m.95580 type:complete len:400 (-) Transcript_53257:56-1255(-)|eukprot:CAMPEP_0197660306 /NCGR_PEP_ID=MMETSP1338-20131121/50769_1 /TAXON_ID=43686 ORGANISM="Pelagodinium beii, Strain RCC1491" /NCGR_SAMPLE_ID=MMETSP1338 /ASSEMBLY_ACC=CAM_ASM_000754 /LENGTH=399 /DNA_ID=CAMNT_0043237633 /DNA_START=80 /DNA_END=1279 /DNA_ORIENTATION=-
MNPSNDMDLDLLDVGAQVITDTVHKILLEMMFFIALLVICELNRYVLQRRGASQNLLKALLVCSLVLGWYAVSVTLILFNKWVLTAGLTCPTFYTDSHMCLKGLLALAYYVVASGEAIPRLPAKLFLGLSLAGAFASLDIMCSNLSLLSISTSLYTLFKSCSLMFVLVFGVITFVEPISVPIVTTVTLVSVGMFLMLDTDTAFNATGIGLVLSSEVFAALRWIVTQVLVQHEVSAMAAVLYMSPAATLTLVPVWIVREPHVFQEVSGMVQENGWLLSAGIFFFPGVLSFLLLLIEVQLVVETSSLTLTAFGSLKSVVTVLFAVAVFGDTVSPIQWAGMLVACIGLLTYSHARGGGDFLGVPALHQMKAGLLHCVGDTAHDEKKEQDETTPLVKNRAQSV